MDDNPYRAPADAGPEPQQNPLVAAGWSILGLVVAADLILTGVIKTFIWGIRDEMYSQIPYGVVALAAGVLVLERLARYFRRLYHPRRNWGSTAIAALVWTVISVGVLIEVVSVIQAFR